MHWKNWTNCDGKAAAAQCFNRQIHQLIVPWESPTWLDYPMVVMYANAWRCEKPMARLICSASQQDWTMQKILHEPLDVNCLLAAINEFDQISSIFFSQFGDACLTCFSKAAWGCLNIARSWRNDHVNFNLLYILIAVLCPINKFNEDVQLTRNMERHTFDVWHLWWNDAIVSPILMTVEQFTGEKHSSHLTQYTSPYCNVYCMYISAVLTYVIACVYKYKYIYIYGKHRKAKPYYTVTALC